MKENESMVLAWFKPKSAPLEPAARPSPVAEELFTGLSKSQQKIFSGLCRPENFDRFEGWLREVRGGRPTTPAFHASSKEESRGELEGTSAILMQERIKAAYGEIASWVLGARLGEKIIPRMTFSVVYAFNIGAPRYYLDFTVKPVK